MALKGLGAAGTARLKAIEKVPEIEFAGIISRRPQVSTLSWDKALQDSAIDAIAISTENTEHPASVEQALRAGKHVLCDYPLAFSAAKARELFALAKKTQKVLHVEHIGLLTEDHQSLKQQAKKLGPQKKGEYLFQAGWSEKLADPQRNGPLEFFALSRLLQVADWFGDFKVESFHKKINQEGFYLHLHLVFKEGGCLGFTEERRAGLPRRRTLLAKCQRGNLNWKPSRGTSGLFLKDLQYFCDRLLKKSTGYYSEETMISVVEEIEKLTS